MHYPRISWISIHHIHRFPNDHSSSHMAKKSAKSIHLGKCFRDLDPTATWGGGFNKPWPPGLGGKQTSPWRSESWIHGVGRAFMSFHSQSAFMSFHIFISFVLYHTTQSVSHFWIKQMVFRNSTQKKKHNHHRSTKRSTSFEKQCRTWVLELGGRGLWGWNLWRKTNQSFQETYGWQEAIGSQIESEGDE